MKKSAAWGLVCSFAAIAALVSGCAAEVARQQTQWQPLSTTPAIIEFREAVTLEPSSGYSRTLNAGSQWREAGRIPQGQVFRPVNGVLTVEGRHVHEAYIVLDGGRVVGFYLPVEQSFAALPPKPVQYQNKGN